MKKLPLHLKKIPPYRWLYNGFCRSVKKSKRLSSITFNDFLEFVKITNCHYCERKIVWPEKAFVRVANRQYKRSSDAYYLDRKNNDLGYTTENCVVCCSTCNSIKSNTLNYDEMMILKPSLVSLAKFQASKQLKQTYVGDNDHEPDHPWWI